MLLLGAGSLRWVVLLYLLLYPLPSPRKTGTYTDLRYGAQRASAAAPAGPGPPSALRAGRGASRAPRYQPHLKYGPYTAARPYNHQLGLSHIITHIAHRFR